MFGRRCCGARCTDVRRRALPCSCCRTTRRNGELHDGWTYRSCTACGAAHPEVEAPAQRRRGPGGVARAVGTVGCRARRRADGAVRRARGQRGRGGLRRPWAGRAAGRIGAEGVAQRAGADRRRRAATGGRARGAARHAHGRRRPAGARARTDRFRSRRSEAPWRERVPTRLGVAPGGRAGGDPCPADAGRRRTPVAVRLRRGPGGPGTAFLQPPRPRRGGGAGRRRGTARGPSGRRHARALLVAHGPRRHARGGVLHAGPRQAQLHARRGVAPRGLAAEHRGPRRCVLVHDRPGLPPGRHLGHRREEHREVHPDEVLGEKQRMHGATGQRSPPGNPDALPAHRAPLRRQPGGGVEHGVLLALRARRLRRRGAARRLRPHARRRLPARQRDAPGRDGLRPAQDEAAPAGACRDVGVDDGDRGPGHARGGREPPAPRREEDLRRPRDQTRELDQRPARDAHRAQAVGRRRAGRQQRLGAVDADRQRRLPARRADRGHPRLHAAAPLLRTHGPVLPEGAAVAGQRCADPVRAPGRGDRLRTAGTRGGRDLRPVRHRGGFLQHPGATARRRPRRRHGAGTRRAAVGVADERRAAAHAVRGRRRRRPAPGGIHRDGAHRAGRGAGHERALRGLQRDRRCGRRRLPAHRAHGRDDRGRTRRQPHRGRRG